MLGGRSRGRRPSKERGFEIVGIGIIARGRYASVGLGLRQPVALPRVAAKIKQPSAAFFFVRLFLLLSRETRSPVYATDYLGNYGTDALLADVDPPACRGRSERCNSEVQCMSVVTFGARRFGMLCCTKSSLN